MERERERASGQEMHRVSEAALSGSVDTLNALIKEDPLILDRISTTWFDETPLHIAVLRGHLDFTKALLSRKPKFSTEVDLLGRLPLHLASVEGYVEIVRELLHVNPDTCFVRDHDGRIPLHLAVMKGRIEVIKELIQARPNSIMDKLDHGETVLHLSVRHNHLEALKLLVEGAIDKTFVNCIDDNGNTALHIAAILKREEIIKYLLLETAVKENANALNNNNFTALDVLEQCPRDLKGMEIRDFLLQAGVERANKDLKSTLFRPSRHRPSRYPPLPNWLPPQISKAWAWLCEIGEARDKNWLNLASNNVMVMATLIATVTFENGINPPGGFWQETDANHQAGTSVLVTTHPYALRKFFRYNTSAFLASLIIIFTLTSGLHLKHRFFMRALTIEMWFVVTNLVFAYLESLSMIKVLRNHKKSLIVSIWLCWLCFFAIFEAWHLLLWIRDKIING